MPFHQSPSITRGFVYYVPSVCLIASWFIIPTYLEKAKKGLGGNISLDLNLEFLNRIVKEAIKKLRPNASKKSINIGYSPLYARCRPPGSTERTAFENVVCVCVCSHFLPYMVCQNKHPKMSFGETKSFK